MPIILHRSSCGTIVAVALALVASTAAFAEPKKSDKPPAASKPPAGTKGATPPAGNKAPSGGATDAGEIEMDSDKGSGVDSGEIQMDDEAKPGDLSADLATTDRSTGKANAAGVKRTPLAWKDIVVVVRKPFLKVRRTEINPWVGTTMNDNMIRHNTIGGELAYYLTDVLAIGIEGQYFTHSFEEPYDLVARQARRLPTVNQYKWSTALDFHYVPVYGKFAILDHSLVAWEAYFTAGIGVGQSEVVPRDRAFPGFTNFLIQPNVGASMRFFITKWMTLNFGIRDYLFIDKYEPADRTPMMNATAAEASSHATSSLVNNIMFQLGLSFWLPTSFDYTTFR